MSLLFRSRTRSILRRNGASESECGIEHGCLDIMMVDNERNLLSKVCATSYDSQDHGKVADSLILELMLINL